MGQVSHCQYDHPAIVCRRFRFLFPVRYCHRFRHYGGVIGRRKHRCCFAWQYSCDGRHAVRADHDARAGFGRPFQPGSQPCHGGAGELPWRDVAPYILVQISFGILGAWAAHLMFDLPVLQTSMKARTGMGQWAGEAIATFGLILTIIGTARHRPQWIPVSVALYITAAYWFTSSTSFANPAITIARSLTNSFSGIAPADVPMFIIAQLAGAIAASLFGRLIFEEPADATSLLSYSSDRTE